MSATAYCLTSYILTRREGFFAAWFLFVFCVWLCCFRVVLREPQANHPHHSGTHFFNCSIGRPSHGWNHFRFFQGFRPLSVSYWLLTKECQPQNGLSSSTRSRFCLRQPVLGMLFDGNLRGTTHSGGYFGGAIWLFSLTSPFRGAPISKFSGSSLLIGSLQQSHVSLRSTCRTILFHWLKNIYIYIYVISRLVLKGTCH